MRVLTAPISELSDYREIIETLESEKTVSLGGCVDSQKLHMVYSIAENFGATVIVTSDDIKAREIYEEYSFYDRDCLLFPAKDLIFYQADIHGSKLTTERVTTLRKLYEGRPVTIITTYAALMSPVVMWGNEDMVKIGRTSLIDERRLSEKLVSLGYEKTYQVENPGEFSVRGGIVDIFDLTEENPYRIELWGDEVDSIRSFDHLSQRSIEELDEIVIYPASEFIPDTARINAGVEKIKKEEKKLEEKFRKDQKAEEAHRIKTTVAEFIERITEFNTLANIESYIRYFYDEVSSLPELIYDICTNTPGRGLPLFVIDEPVRVEEQARAVETEFRDSCDNRLDKGYILPGQANILFSGSEIAAVLGKMSVLTLSAIDQKNHFFKASKKSDVNARSVAPYNNSFESLVKDLSRYKKNGFRVVLLSASRTRASRLAEDLRDNGITAIYTEDPDREVNPGEVVTFYGHVARGFEYPLLKYVVISETDIFGAEKKRKKKKKLYHGTQIQDFNELKVGDIVVHVTHGLGIYKGIEKVEMEHVVKDYMKIEYRDGGILYIPATGFDVVQKYSSNESGQTPRLNKLGTKEWEHTTTKVKSAVNEIAKDLVELYAQRQQGTGYQYGPDTVWQKEFEEIFPYEETEDQLAAIAETKRDMESGKIMDRLICGDVGYGKTEIAIRAAFKAVSEGKQVVYLVPTTILAQQHYNTFTQRMKDFPIKIELLSRFRTQSEIKKAVDDLKKGFVDIVIGTHRVLSKDVEFKDLGLLIIDEEQRFGVTHKEKIKKLKENVDVLTLTATPIPRTLHMSLIGIRDMSILEEAPQDRLPIQTFVCEYNEEMVREAIARELGRGGQVYYVYNRVNNIADVAAKLQDIVPEANITYAHGQMNEHELENIMVDFINGEIDVLVSTTIIETGLDIPNANTIIIHDSENMGLSQLYQLRGRVGRSNRNAYAFLMYKRDKVLKEVAEKRLEAIREFTDLGSGFKIAMRDLEIRGAGNLLGMRQSGHMEAVGYDMYCRMLDEAIKTLKGEETATDFQTLIELDVDAYIPSEYIMNETQKLDIYKKIAGIETLAERDDMHDELVDRFGALPECVENLLRISLIRVSAHKVFLTDVKGRNGKIILTFKPDACVNPDAIPTLIAKYGSNLSFTAYGKPYFTLRYQESGIVEKDERILLDTTEDILKSMQILIED